MWARERAALHHICWWKAPPPQARVSDQSLSPRFRCATFLMPRWTFVHVRVTHEVIVFCSSRNCVHGTVACVTALAAAFLPGVRCFDAAFAAAALVDRSLCAVGRSNNSCILVLGEQRLAVRVLGLGLGVPPQRMVVLQCTIILRGGYQESCTVGPGYLTSASLKIPFPAYFLVSRGSLWRKSAT